ncbi:MAG TPA: N-acetylmuramoyl-L-alanine amidase [Alphaproteobacteria bacterium]
MKKFPIILNNSPNYDARPHGTPIDKIILHYTGMQTAQEALERLCDNGQSARIRGRVSAHYMVDEDGTVYALVDEEDRAWHAGVSYWQGQTDLNNSSIGIELVNPGHEFGYHPFPRPQLESIVQLAQSICKRHQIRQEYVLGHSDVAPGRKMDPGEKFNWRFLASRGIGILPEPQSEDYTHAQFYLTSPTALRHALIRVGYNPDLDLALLCRAFNHHFGNTDSTELSWETAASLSALSRRSL